MSYKVGVIGTSELKMVTGNVVVMRKIGDTDSCLGIVFRNFGDNHILILDDIKPTLTEFTSFIVGNTDFEENWQIIGEADIDIKVTNLFNNL